MGERWLVMAGRCQARLAVFAAVDQVQLDIASGASACMITSA